jgi:galactokinase
MEKSLVCSVKSTFKETFAQDPFVVCAPGRVNLIGEHTDYNNGFVLPAAIDKAIYLATGKRTDNVVHLISLDLKDSYLGNIKEIVKNDHPWSHYILGVLLEIQKLGHSLSGFNLVFSGDIPLGAGLSSSAALECGVAFAVNQLFNLGLDNITLVKLSQKAENEFVGVKCGIMDQFASIMGRRNAVLQLDCQTLAYEFNPLEMDGIEIVLFDSNVSHSLASSEYNTRRAQCEAGVLLVHQKYEEVKTLRDVTLEMLDELVLPVDPLIYKRCRYVVQENNRLIEGCKDLKRRDVAAFGRKMFETHEGLSKDYAVSCSELDFLIECVKNNPDVLGARMMGGGFGGCTINLVREAAVTELVQDVAKKYHESLGNTLKVYMAKIEDGVHAIL